MVKYMVMYPNLPLGYKQESREKWNKLCVDCRRLYNRLLEIERDPATAEIEHDQVLAERMRLAVSKSAAPALPQESPTPINLAANQKL